MKKKGGYILSFIAAAGISYSISKGPEADAGIKESYAGLKKAYEESWNGETFDESILGGRVYKAICYVIPKLVANASKIPYEAGQAVSTDTIDDIKDIYDDKTNDNVEKAVKTTIGIPLIMSNNLLERLVINPGRNAKNHPLDALLKGGYSVGETGLSPYKIFNIPILLK